MNDRKCSNCGEPTKATITPPLCDKCFNLIIDKKQAERKKQAKASLKECQDRAGEYYG